MMYLHKTFWFFRGIALFTLVWPLLDCFALHVSSQTEVVTHYYRSVTAQYHIPLALFLSLSVDDVTAQDSITSYVETDADFSKVQTTADIYVHELYYRSPLYFNQLRATLGRHHISDGFHPLMSDALALDWQARKNLRMRAYFGNAYFENAVNFTALKWNPMAGGMIQYSPSSTWTFSPAIRYLRIDSRPTFYGAFHVLKTWPFPRTWQSGQRTYAWVGGTPELTKLTTEAQVEYEAESGRITGVLGQVGYLDEDIYYGFQARIGAKYTRQPLQFKLDSERKSVLEIFGINALMQVFASAYLEPRDGLSLEASYAYHQYPNHSGQKQHGHLLEAGVGLKFWSNGWVTFRPRYYSGFGGWLMGGSVNFQKPLLSFLSMQSSVDVDRYFKVNNISDLSLSFRNKLIWFLLRGLRSETTLDIERTHVFALDTKAMVYLIYEHN